MWGFRALTSNEFRDRFEKIRTEKRMSNTEIAQALGKSKQAFSSLKKVGNPGYKIIKRIAEVMNVHPSAFF